MERLSQDNVVKVDEMRKMVSDNGKRKLFNYTFSPREISREQLEA